jgi:RNA polymerase primary sigma factor
MNEKLFMQLIEELKDIAATQDNTLTFSQIRERMEQLNLTEDKLEVVYTYLEGERIRISERKAVKKMVPTKESSRPSINETEIYRAYMTDLEVIPPCSEEEIANLCDSIQKGDEASKKRLVEGSLLRVAEYVKKYAGKGVPVTDLIQEANVALMLYVAEAKAENYWSNLEKEIDTMLEVLIEESQGSNSIKEKIADRANRLLAISAELAEELEREPTLEELAEHLHISEDEVRTVMKHSISAMNIDENSLS